MRASRRVRVAVTLSMIFMLVLPTLAGAQLATDVVEGTTFAEPGSASFSLAADRFASGFNDVVFVTGSGDGSGDLYVVEQRGRIWKLTRDQGLADEPFLDIADEVLRHHERGMLGLAFHPDYAENGTYYVAYTRQPDGATVLREFGGREMETEGGEGFQPRPDDPEYVPGPHGRTLLVLPQPFAWHKAGMLEFDSAGMLLMTTGDGGGGGDPLLNGLDPSSLLGKLLRFDVDRGWPYGLPPDNGFAAVAGARPEVHAIGLRNPWRFSVDQVTGDIFLGDVGQSDWEEIDVLVVGDEAVSFGWSDMEGPACFKERKCDPQAHRAPAIAIPHLLDGVGLCAVIGGYVYRGDLQPLLDGQYLFGDHCSRMIWAADAASVVAGDVEPVLVATLDEELGQIRTFGRDDDGELYAATSTGDLLALFAEPAGDG